MRKMIHGESGPFWPLVYFHSFEALNDAFEVQFSQGFIFTPYQTTIPFRTMQLRFFFKVKKLLNNAFKHDAPKFLSDTDERRLPSIINTIKLDPRNLFALHEEKEIFWSHVLSQA